MAAGDEYPVVANEDGIKLKTEKMVPDQLYHVIHEGKVFLFYKDQDSLLHCYEVENPDVVREIVENPSQLESILKKYAQPS